MLRSVAYKKVDWAEGIKSIVTGRGMNKESELTGKMGADSGGGRVTVGGRGRGGRGGRGRRD